MGIATRIKDVSDNFAEAAYVYSVAPKAVFWDRAGVKRHTRFVVVSAVTVLDTPETYIFPCDRNGDPKSWIELEGSYRGGLDHDEAIHRAGYKTDKGGA